MRCGEITHLVGTRGEEIGLEDLRVRRALHLHVHRSEEGEEDLQPAVGNEALGVDVGREEGAYLPRGTKGGEMGRACQGR